MADYQGRLNAVALIFLLLLNAAASADNVLDKMKGNSVDTVRKIR